MSSCLHDCFNTYAITSPPWVAFSGHFLSGREKFCKNNIREKVHKNKADIADNAHNGELELLNC